MREKKRPSLSRENRCILSLSWAQEGFDDTWWMSSLLEMETNNSSWVTTSFFFTCYRELQLHIVVVVFSH